MSFWKGRTWQVSFLFGDEIISIELCKSSHHGEYLAGQSEVDSIVDRCRVAACVELVALLCGSAGGCTFSGMFSPNSRAFSTGKKSTLDECQAVLNFVGVAVPQQNWWWFASLTSWDPIIQQIEILGPVPDLFDITGIPQIQESSSGVTGWLFQDVPSISRVFFCRLANRNEAMFSRWNRVSNCQTPFLRIDWRRKDQIESYGVFYMQSMIRFCSTPPVYNPHEHLWFRPWQTHHFSRCGYVFLVWMLIYRF